jgi:tetraacyldisaccharide 4'-kinase
MTARRPWAWPLVPLYWSGLRIKDGLRASGILPTWRLGWPVLSVGSLSAGGAGKTPVVLALARLLHDHGWTTDILSRGYGRQGSGVERVLLDAPDGAARFGDEPVMMAAELSSGQSVWVGADRFASGREAEGYAGAHRPGTAHAVHGIHGVHILDDGFQHRRLGRSVDLVLVTAADLDDALLPAGNRREPLAALRRAHVVLLREPECAELAPRLRRWMRPGAAIFSYRRRLAFDAPAGFAAAGPGPLAFCAIARPEGFIEMLEDAGCTLVKTVVFRDHFSYGRHDVEHLVTAARQCGATGFVTTAKDWVKFSPPMRDRLTQGGAVAVARLDAHFPDPRAILNALEARLG